MLLSSLPAVAYSWSTRTTTTRRSMLQQIVVIGGTSCGCWKAQRPSPAFAKNLPDVSPSVDPTRTPGTTETLQPILRLEAVLKELHTVLDQAKTQQPSAVAGDATSSSNVLKELTTQTRTIPRTEREFKAIFDAYSDPVSYKQKFVDQNAFLVYYTKGFDGPGRPSMESDLPVKQTLQYGARNDAWVAYDDFCVELDYQRSRNDLGEDNNNYDPEELQKHLQRAIDAVDSYLKASNVR